MGVFFLIMGNPIGVFFEEKTWQVDFWKENAHNAYNAVIPRDNSIKKAQTTDVI